MPESGTIRRPQRRQVTGRSVSPDKQKPGGSSRHTRSSVSKEAKMGLTPKPAVPLEDLDPDCKFCDIIKDPNKAVTKIHHDESWEDFLVMEPIGPVTENGHYLVIPRKHVRDAEQDDEVFGATCACASRVAKRLHHGADVNIVNNQGPLAGQTVGHLHVHVVVRGKDDGLKLPWTGQKRDHYNTTGTREHPDHVKPKLRTPGM